VKSRQKTGSRQVAKKKQMPQKKTNNIFKGEHTKTASAQNNLMYAGFTLTELLVTITVISLLAAVLVPILRKARGQTRATLCMSNLRQWDLGYKLYAAENDSKYPPAEPQSTTDIWMTQLQTYCSDIQTVRHCPSALKVKETSQISTGILGATKSAWYLTAPFDLPPHYRTGSYAKNIYATPLLTELALESSSSPVANYWSGPEEKGAGQTPLLIDARWYSIAPDETQPLPADGNILVSDTSKTWVDSAAMRRHGDGINTLFLSATIVKVSAEELWNLRWHKNYKKRGRVPLPNMGGDI
jgi:prepilin-type N-terminal cleavage/methylation domain-containing protein